jgi:hypothetical protein
MRAPIPIFKTNSFLNFKEYVTDYIFFRNFKRDTLGTISTVFVTLFSKYGVFDVYLSLFELPMCPLY